MTTAWIIATALLGAIAVLFVALIIHDRNWWQDEKRKFYADKYDREENKWYKSTHP